jgi:hypothetical protein
MNLENMSDARNKRAVEIQDAIQLILYYDWNPIPCDNLPLGEYDSYIAPIYRILTNNRSEEKLIDFLVKTECDTLGLEEPKGTQDNYREKLRPVAKKLLALDVKL